MNFVNPYTWGAVNPNNRIRDCRTALWARQSRVNAGDGGDLGELSSIYNNIDCDLCAQQNTWILANYDYWGGGEPRVTGDGSSIVFGTDNYLTYDPWAGKSLPIQVAANSDTEVNVATVSASLAVDSKATNVQHDVSSRQTMIPSGTDTTSKSLADDLALGMSYERNQQYSKAIMHYKRMVKMGRAPFIALSAIAGIAGRSSETEIVRYLESLSGTAGDYQAHALHLLGDIYLANGDSAKAIASYEKLVESFSNSPGARSARFALFYHSLFAEKDRNNARRLLDEIASKYSVDDRTTDVEVAKQLFNYFSESSAESRSNLFSKKRTSSMDVDSTYNGSPESGLEWNYPNPFNPTTVIRYSLLKPGQVILRVYDVLGREVATLVNEHQGAGVHSATFDGSRLASGVYFYRLTAPGVNLVKKMLLTK